MLIREFRGGMICCEWRNFLECGMARNKVQFRKGLSEAEFDRLYGTEEACRAIVYSWRWAKGFVCPVCGDTRHGVVKPRPLFQCTGCGRQTSLTAGTIFAQTHLPLT